MRVQNFSRSHEELCLTGCQALKLSDCKLDLRELVASSYHNITVFRLLSIAGCCLLSSATGLFAPALRSGEIAASQTPSAAATPAPARSRKRPRPPSENDVILQFPNSDVMTCSATTNSSPARADHGQFRERKGQHLSSPNDPTREEAIQIIEMNLLMNGFSLVPAEGDIVKVIGTGKNPRTAGCADHFR